MNTYQTRQAKLTEAKTNTAFVADMLMTSDDPHLHNLAVRMRVCANQVKINQSSSRIYFGEGCKIRHCQVCEWRASLKLMAQVAQVGEIVANDYPDCVWFRVVLTVSNPRLARLRQTINDLNNAFTRMSRSWSAVGALKILEYPSADTGTGDQQVLRVNLHANVIVLVPRHKTQEFGSQIGGWWAKANRSGCLGFSCDPLSQSGLVGVAAYYTKPTPISFDPDYTIALAAQLHHVHRFQPSGVVKQMMSRVTAEWKANKDPNYGYYSQPGIVHEYDSRSEVYRELSPKAPPSPAEIAAV